MRLFFALPLAEHAREEIMRGLIPLRRQYPTFKWIPSQNLHITLVFVGECGDDEAYSLRERFFRIDHAAHPFSITWRGIGTFPGGGPPRVLHLPVQEGSDEVRRLHGMINHTLWKEKREGRFFPHITVARVKGKGGERSIERESLFRLGASVKGGSVVDRIVLYRSQLRSEGACYSNFGSLSLGRQDDLEEK